MYRHFFKRFFDILVSCLGMPLLLIVFIPVAVLIKIEDGGPLFYNALRTGKSGRPFKMYKFRSMKVNSPDLRRADGSTYNARNDPRLTKAGKIIREISLDELPQLINIFLGQMSFIGPRPNLVSEKNNTKERRIILKVRPGLTGYSQAYFRNQTDAEGKTKNDIYYVENLSLLLDLKIMFRTIYTVVKRDKIYRDL